MILLNKKTILIFQLLLVGQLNAFDILDSVARERITSLIKKISIPRVSDSDGIEKGLSNNYLIIVRIQ